MRDISIFQPEHENKFKWNCENGGRLIKKNLCMENAVKQILRYFQSFCSSLNDHINEFPKMIHLALNLKEQ